MKYQAIIFDLFDTLVFFDYTKMPEIVVHGKTRRTTMGKTFEILSERCPDLEWDSFFEALAEVDEQLRPLKEEGREVSSTERFRRVMDKLLPNSPACHAPDFIENLVKRHMDALLACAYFPDGHRDVLKALRQDYRLALLSNFDYAPAAQEMLDHMGLLDYFIQVEISDELGWRKPHPGPFQDLVEDLGVTPRESLYVGDTHETDIVGAKGAGLDAAWLNPKRKVLKPGDVRPDFELRSLEELLKYLLPNRGKDSR
jgi:putative hydrolase of the HAD superfamily